MSQRQAFFVSSNLKIMIFSKVTPFNADIYTPIELYLSLRNRYRKTCLLESNEYHSRSNSKTFLGLNPIIEITVENLQVTIQYQEKKQQLNLTPGLMIGNQIQQIINQFKFENPNIHGNGFIGRIGFEFSHLTENQIEKMTSSHSLPDIHLFLFESIIVLDHFTDNGYVISNGFNENDVKNFSTEDFFKKETYIELPFELIGEESSDFTDKEFADIVSKGIKHCKRGDVFQLVVSNEFKQSFFGDDFQVYRQLRRLNPSPYLFYFDFESYRLLGSSPEAQLIVKNGEAEIHPIAGTAPRTGDEKKDAFNLNFLLNSEKENAEHTMLVDLARNDLSKNCSPVKVDVYKEIQHFSHVTHLVSKVTGKLKQDEVFEVFNNSFPAGTLSGTPKPKALELISKYEKTTRDFYGGAVGLIGSNGDLNLAIVIRSMLSMNNNLYYRAGAGVLIDSEVESEVKEVHHKLRAVRTAIEKAAKQSEVEHSTI